MASDRLSESFLSGSSSVYAEEMYEAWKQDPSSVHASWNAYFRNIDAGANPGQAFAAPPTLGSGAAAAPAAGARAAPAMSAEASGSMLNVVALTRAFQVRGHEQASLDPLGLQERKYVPELDPATYGFTEADLDKPVGPLPAGLLSAPVSADTPLRDLISRLETLYCGHIGIEYMHIQSREKCDWIRERVEGLSVPFDKAGKKQVYDRLAHAHTFESFMAGKYSTTKRFGLEGCESLIPGLKALIDAATERGVQNVVLGMPHRGRLNVLANVIRKPLETLFKEFQGEDTVATGSGEELGDFSVAGDVKYHLGTSYDRSYPDGRNVHLSLMANPSHLEAVDPVVVGKAYAKQFFDKDPEGHRTMPLLLHGDAAFAGQGVVYETMHFSNLENYRTGGTVHVIVNNQIGFTTDPVEARSSAYSSDVGKAFNCPILHVNADHPEAVTRVFQLAAEWRQAFHEDVIVDLIGYRRSGHNEMDQPSFTQPVMYSVIGDHKPVLDLYTEALEKEGVLAAADLTEIRDNVVKTHETAFENSKAFNGKHDWLDSRWSGFKGPGQMSRIRETGVDRDLLHKVGVAVSTIPDDFKPHRMIKKIYDVKKKSIEEGHGIDWGTAEALAWGTLLGEDNHVRISGQDVERGTFSHRHAVLHDQRDNALYTPLNNLTRLGAMDRQAEFVATNSPLSEFGTLGFETGYALESPNQLVLWEAQFGDFVNGAQVMIDQFISSGEDKWLRQLGLVMLLPHGYDGQGAEHSSCRIERFLQCSNEDPDDVPPLDESNSMQIQRTNWQVCNITEPGNYFHALRRQIHREFRKPLIVASPKNLLRHKMATSTLDSMASGTKFRRVIAEAAPEEIESPDKVKKVVFCSGKIYYELLTARRERESKDVALVRVEQLSPFPFDLVAREMANYENAEVVWCQEEPQNMGYWTHVAPRFETAAESINNDSRRPSYVGRHASAAPAVGYAARHKQEQDAIMADVFA